MKNIYKLLIIAFCTVIAFSFLSIGNINFLTYANAASFAKKKALKKKTKSAQTKKKSTKVGKKKRQVSSLKKKENKNPISKNTQNKLETLKKTENKIIKKIIAKNYTGLKTDFGGGFIAYEGKIKGDRKAYARIENRKGVFYIMNINKGNLPIGSGSQLLAHTIRHHNINFKNKLIIKTINNEETQHSYNRGMKAEYSKLGKLIINTLKELGREPKNMRFFKTGDKLNILVLMK